MLHVSVSNGIIGLTYVHTIIKEKKLNLNLYQLNLQIIKPKNQVNTVQEKKISWTMWHLWYGHIGYSGLQKLVDKKLVDSLEVDETSPKPDCEACTKAKMHVSTFLKQAKKQATKNSQRTHVDLWGKMPITSIEGYSCFINFTNDKAQWATVEGLKQKNEVTQKAKDYISYLKTHGMMPEAIQCDKGEFLNSWCHSMSLEFIFL